MNLKDELQSILRHLRRLYFITFRKDYVIEQVKKRKGKCGRHGCCDLTLLARIFSRNCLSKTDRTKCLRRNNLPYVCYVCPFDEKDKQSLTKNICNFYWEDENKKLR